MTNEQLISRAIKLGAHVNVHPEMPERPAIGITVDRLQALLAEVVANEREACALVCEDQAFRSMQKSHRAGTVGKAATHQARSHGAQFCAAAIRQRETKN